MTDGQAVFALVGATATGKTDLAASVAETLGAEIVCADSRQVFTDLDLGTGKPLRAQRRAQPHHLFDALSLEEQPSAGWFARAATAAIASIRARGKRPLLVGGAGLYLRALREGLAEEAPLDPEDRKRLRQEYEACEVAELWTRLERLDAESAARLHPNDRQRISRALEVAELTGRPIGWWHTRPAGPPIAGAWHVAELRVPASRLSHRIENRTAWMFANGLIEETRALLDRGLEASLRRHRAVGYDETLDLLTGRATRSQAELRTTQRTRQLAKRQRTWFRHQVRASVLEGGSGESLLRTRLLEIFRGD